MATDIPHKSPEYKQGLRPCMSTTRDSRNIYFNVGKLTVKSTTVQSCGVMGLAWFTVYTTGQSHVHKRRKKKIRTRKLI